MVMDDLYYRRDDVSCQVNTTAQRGWALPTQIVLYNSSVFVVGISYPIIWWKVRERRKIDPRANGQEMRALDTDNNGGTSSKRISNTVEARASVEMSSRKQNPASSQPADTDDNPAEGPVNGRLVVERQKPPKKPSQSFTVLTYLVVGVVICWTPIMVYFTMAIVNDYDNYLHFILGTLLYHSNSVLDPIFFTMAMVPLRTTLLRMFSWR
ncbi:hypothetical protein BV898_00536 [Hypsibius exemplaris]|uniref:G-protein coupled receptors family 1 profile domain-containing protein n=1 Tax=Hypsibius exemplaris TaxID=2072580 RepID=A0A1W0XDR4_HYPEX|nr:hypothetical protein BV898_00536 [Hypsibius exemplaris]